MTEKASRDVCSEQIYAAILETAVRTMAYLGESPNKTLKLLRYSDINYWELDKCFNGSEARKEVARAVVARLP